MGPGSFLEVGKETGFQKTCKADSKKWEKTYKQKHWKISRIIVKLWAPLIGVEGNKTFPFSSTISCLFPNRGKSWPTVHWDKGLLHLVLNSSKITSQQQFTHVDQKMHGWELVWGGRQVKRMYLKFCFGNLRHLSQQQLLGLYNGYLHGHHIRNKPYKKVSSILWPKCSSVEPIPAARRPGGKSWGEGSPFHFG